MQKSAKTSNSRKAIPWKKPWGSSFLRRGSKAGRFTMRRPAKVPQHSFFSFSGEPRLFLQFKLTGTPAQIAASDLLVYQDHFRLVLTGDDGFEFAQLFWPQFRLWRSGYGYTQPVLYPRQTKTLFLRIDEHDAPDQPYRTVACFTTHIAPEPLRTMTPEKLPIKRSIQGLDFVIGEVSVVKAVPSGWGYKYKTRMVFQVLDNGQPQTNWWAFPIEGQDAGGNSVPMGGFTHSTNGWIVITNLTALDPRKPWRLRMNFGRASGSDFPATNLATFDLMVLNYNLYTANQSIGRAGAN